MDRLERIKKGLQSKDQDDWLTWDDIEWLIETVGQQQRQIQELESEIVALRNVNNSI